MRGLNMESLRFGTKLHQNIVDALNARKNYSRKKTASRRSKWSTDEEKFMAYLPTTEDDELRDTKKSNGKPQYTTVEIPYSYALLLAAHTYESSIFLARSPVMQFDDRHGAGTANTQAVEALMDYQVNVGGMLVPYYLWLMDKRKYGLGIVGHYWDTEMIRTSKIMEVPEMWNGVPLLGQTKKEKRTVTIPGYHGNRVFNIRPQDFLPDPRVPISRHQSGEFCGYVIEMGWNDLVVGQHQGVYFNADTIKRKYGRSGKTLTDRDMGSSQMEMPDQETDARLDVGEIPTVGMLEGYDLFVRLIPRDWKLGQSELPEMWVFTVINNEVIIRAQPLGEFYDKYPIDVMEHEMEGHQFSKRSMLEMAAPLNDTLTWLFNTHFFNVRKSLNNQFIMDPSRVVMKDAKNADEGMIIRMRPSAYGTGIENAIKQLPVMDITANHMKDAQIVMQMMQRLFGVNDQMMGMQAPGGRKTATEIRGSSAAGMNRLKTDAEYASAMGFQPHATKLLQATQQHYDLERMYKIAGDLLPGQPQEMMVSPEMIAGFFDYIPVDGTMPVDRYAMANLFKEILIGMKQFPELAQRYDMGSMFAYTMQLAGAKNIQRFQIKVVPDQQLENATQAGNVVPMVGGANGRRAGTVSPRDEAGYGRAGEPGQIPGVGPTG